MALLSDIKIFNHQLRPQKKPEVKTKEFIPDDFKKVATGMEQQFLQYMLQQMNNSVQKTGEESTAGKYYKGLLDTERAKSFSNSDLGHTDIKSLILNQIYPQKFRNQAAYNAYQKSKGSMIHKKSNEVVMGPRAQVTKASNEKSVSNILKHTEDI